MFKNFEKFHGELGSVHFQRCVVPLRHGSLPQIGMQACILLRAIMLECSRLPDGPLRSTTVAAETFFGYSKKGNKWFSLPTQRPIQHWQREICLRIKQKRRKVWIHTDGTGTFEGSSVENNFHLFMSLGTKRWYLRGTIRALRIFFRSVYCCLKFELVLSLVDCKCIVLACSICCQSQRNVKQNNIMLLIHLHDLLL